MVIVWRMDNIPFLHIIIHVFFVFFCFSAPKASRKRAADKEQVTSKIIVRNIPFESNEKEIRELFRLV